MTASASAQTTLSYSLLRQKEVAHMYASRRSKWKMGRAGGGLKGEQEENCLLTPRLVLLTAWSSVVLTPLSSCGCG